LQLMNNGQFRHLPVVENEELLGFVSILDVTKSLLALRGKTIDKLQHYVSETWPF
jgi:CBS domain-containing protein